MTPSILALQQQIGQLAQAAPASGFTPLEITKLLVDALTPLAVLFLGIWLNRLAKRLEQAQWTNQKLIEKRIAVYDAMAPKLNDILCFCTFVGGWQTLKPEDILASKRELDRSFYVTGAFFTSALETAYHRFINTCFKTWSGHGVEAKLRIGRIYRKQHLPGWQDTMAHYFLDPEDTTKEDVRKAYSALMSQYASEIGLRPSAPIC